MVFHHGAPPHEPESIFDFYRDHVQEWVASEKQYCLFDRAWPCSYVLETFRRHNNGHVDDILDLEIELMDCPFAVQHVVVHRPWSWSARHHIEEIRSLNPTWPDWKVRDEYAFRMKEHQLYYDRTRDFTENVTAFPTIWFEGGKFPESDAEGLMYKIQESK